MGVTMDNMVSLQKKTLRALALDGCAKGFMSALHSVDSDRFAGKQPIMVCSLAWRFANLLLGRSFLKRYQVKYFSHSQVSDLLHRQSQTYQKTEQRIGVKAFFVVFYEALDCVVRQIAVFVNTVHRNVIPVEQFTAFQSDGSASHCVSVYHADMLHQFVA